MTDASSLAGAFDGVHSAYFLVHAMAGGAGFHERELLGARNFARAAAGARGRSGSSTSAGSATTRPPSTCAAVTRPPSPFSEQGPPLTYFRAAMVVGAGSESYRTLRYLVKRLPVMIAPSWLRTDTQPIAIDDVIEFLAGAPDVPESAGREVQIGGPDILSYGDMLDRMADAMGARRRPKVPVPLLTPWLSALWLGLVTPVDTNVARPLVEGLRTATVVTDPSGAAAFGIEPVPFDVALRRALARRARRRVTAAQRAPRARPLHLRPARARQPGPGRRRRRARPGGAGVRARRAAAGRELRARRTGSRSCATACAISTPRCARAARAWW